MRRGLLGLVILGSVAFAAAAQPRLDYAHPTIGGTMRIIVDHVRPFAPVLLVEDADGDGSVDADELEFAFPMGEGGRADASGTVRHDLRILDERPAGSFIAVEQPVPGDGLPMFSAPVSIPFQAPSLLLTGVDASTGRGRLFRIPFRNGRLERAASLELGAGAGARPLGAVRDGHGTKTYLIADASSGLVSILRDDLRYADLRYAESLPLPVADLRAIAVTPDGSRLVVTAAGGGGGWLYVIDTATDRLAAGVFVGDLGPTGGKVAITPDSLMAFVSVAGLIVLPVDLLNGTVGMGVAVGGPGQDAVRDVRVAYPWLLALTGRLHGSGPMDSLTWIGLPELRRFGQEGRFFASSRIDVRPGDGGSSLVLFDGSHLIAVDLNRGLASPAGAGWASLGAGSLFGALRALPFQGTGPLGDWFLFEREGSGIVALDGEVLRSARGEPVDRHLVDLGLPSTVRVTAASAF